MFGAFEYAGLTIEGKTFKVSTPIPGNGLTNAQTASAALQTEIATYIGDVATALTNAIAGNGPTGDSDADVQAIADQLNADITTLTGADSALPTGSGTTGTSGTP
jgi:hypothetical protein